MSTIYKITFPESTHWVTVVVHRSLRGLRGATERRMGDSKGFTNTIAFCFKCYKPVQEGIAEIHFARERLNYDTIAHECFHAAYWRTVVLGVPSNHPDFEEHIAQDTGCLTGAVVGALRKLGIKVSYHDRRSKIR